MKALKLIFAMLILMIIIACWKDDSGIISEGNDPNFKIVANSDGILRDYDRKVEVFGVNIYAVTKVDDAKLLHAANLMAQYLDNDEDGIPDNQLVVDKMVANNAFMVMWKRQSDIPNNPPDNSIGQDLGNDETHPLFVENGRTGTFDAGLEEVLHIITHAGYAQVYPNIFGEQIGTEIGDAMDIARGGQFTSVPNSYPTNAWYTYDDETCDYSCMVTEYTYWALTSLLTAQENRLSEIEQEWKLNTSDKVQQQDIAIYQLLTDSQYAFPTVLPDGTYKH